ncbi:hypothetical protein E6P09_07750 [Haloferax mediterranei ATCC 33500]|uniref:Oxidase n=1 Tax=Haloferax mediterranei (strain ATCC 33500 / DSM 1411 / JCM 8866 / NBRC 14739 / NCIMB 2177 / R-4) TaxID=523841 RepID=I3R350_HALMT|nr:hypothetical protein [Haloferax mediterranei]AFK18660.1 cytochrome-ba3 oxidase subunit [Haloferax mediterranei ATCC 33500]AHZ21971.1 oxidase [Haloferax mediterranei ATCC 33500]EMA03482.1 cytochrome-ba3 oxidase subunit [Haloferax mediterranei ATCC 33500]MDX5988754.1 hypothetical protein [Haloferax mediterranei ATCC 33500]QCQ75161.1 hypothetical protein E6P09_07750 [Haloferax mediterranei ATCC 33500]
MELTPRLAGTVALLALLPVIIFGVTKNPLAGVVTVVNVLLISTVIYLLMSPTEGGHDHDAGHDADRDADHEHTA